MTAYFVCVEERTDEDGGDSRQLCGELVPLLVAWQLPLWQLHYYTR